MSRHFELVVFTASKSGYANPVIARLFGDIFTHKLYWQHCTEDKEGFYLKNLAELGRDLTKTFIIDNIPWSYAMQPRNGIPIKSWYNEPSDDELIKLIPLL